MKNLKIYIAASFIFLLNLVGCRTIPAVSTERTLEFQTAAEYIQIPQFKIPEYVGGSLNTIAEALDCGYSERLLTLGTNETFDQNYPEFRNHPTPEWIARYDIGSVETGWNVFIYKVSMMQFVRNAQAAGCNVSNMKVLYTHTTWSGNIYQIVINEHFRL